MIFFCFRLLFLHARVCGSSVLVCKFEFPNFFTSFGKLEESFSVAGYRDIFIEIMLHAVYPEIEPLETDAVVPQGSLLDYMGPLMMAHPYKSSSTLWNQIRCRTL